MLRLRQYKQSHNKYKCTCIKQIANGRDWVIENVKNPFFKNKRVMTKATCVRYKRTKWWSNEKAVAQKAAIRLPGITNRKKIAFIFFGEAVLTCTKNLCFGEKKKKNWYTPAYPKFYYIKVGPKGVFISQTCFLMNGKPITYSHGNCAFKYTFQNEKCTSTNRTTALASSTHIHAMNTPLYAPFISEGYPFFFVLFCFVLF